MPSRDCLVEVCLCPPAPGVEKKNLRMIIVRLRNKLLQTENYISQIQGKQ